MVTKGSQAGIQNRTKITKATAISATSPKKRLVVLISGGGSNLQSLIAGCQTGEIHGQIVAVISNRPAVLGLQRAAQAGIPTHVLDHAIYPDRAAFEKQLQQQIDAFQPDLVLLAGFMRILGSDLVQHYQGRILNIHPSLLPAYKGINTHQRVLDNGDQKHGASVHFVTPDLDGGPVIIQAQVAVTAEDTAATLAKRVLAQEHQIYPQAVSWYCAERLTLQAGQVCLDDQVLAQPVMHSC